MKKILLLAYCVPLFVAAQEDVWDTYMASYEKGVGSVVLNMSIRSNAPRKALPFVVVTGVTFKGCSPDGMPFGNTFDTLYRVSDSVSAFIKSKTEFLQAGSFTYQCERLDYIYIKDTTGIRAGLEKMYARSFPGFGVYINVKDDQSWKYYLEFLYPNELIKEYMRNQKVILQLANSGDKLDKERLIEHFAYFKTEADRDCFIRYVLSKKYTVAGTKKTDRSTNSLQVLFSRVDKPDLNSLSEETLALKKQAEGCNGEYDGWETAIVK